MPDDPNSNVEEQLAAWARKRREEAGAPIELHPATRRLLQDEVARTFPKKTAEPAADAAPWWKMFWPRFALAGSLCLGMAVLAGILLPGVAKSKSKAQQVALVRQQEKALSAESGRRDAPAQMAPDGSGGRAAGAPVRHFGDDAGKSAAAESQPPAVPSLVENKPLEQKVKAEAELKDVRLKAGQPAAIEERSFSEKSGPVLLSEKAKESPAVATAPADKSSIEKESNQALVRQRYAAAPAQKGSLTSANTSADERKIPQTPRATQPQVALDGAAVGQRAGGVAGRGYAAGPASNAVSGVNLAYSPAPNTSTADVRPLASARSSVVASGNVDFLTQRRETDRFGTANVPSFSPASAPQRFAQVREHRVNFNSPPMPDVLNSFQLAQIGRQIRVVDADGSIYDGAIEQSPGEAAARSGIALQTTATELKKNNEPETRRGVASAMPGELPEARNVFFRVAGTNRTLNQLVVFEGNFLLATNRSNEIVVGAKLKVEQSAASPRQGLSPQAQQAPSGLIRGQALIGPSSRIEINAAPVSE